MRQKIPVGYLKKLPLEPVEWGWASPAGGMFTSIEDIAKVKLLPVCSRCLVSNEHALSTVNKETRTTKRMRIFQY